MADAASVIFDDNDIPFEEEVLRHPCSLVSWQRYIDYKASKLNAERELYMVYERALLQLPGSYRLWNEYLRIRRTKMLQRCIDDPEYGEVNDAHERALIFMHKMPRIWIEYCKFLVHQRLITRTRRAFDRALCSLPVTQHNRVWEFYIIFVTYHNIPKTTLYVYQRYLKVYPDDVEDFISFLLKAGYYNEASKELIKVINKEKIVSKYNQTRYQFVYQLCELLTKHCECITDLSIPNVLRSTINQFSDGSGQLWCMLAEYYIKNGLLEMARDIFEEGINNVTTVKDFGKIYDAYIHYEENVISSAIERTKKDPSKDKFELELLFERLEDLIDKRPLLLSSVLLRQNPHNVNEWLKRSKLYDDLGLKNDVIRTFEEATKTVNSNLAVGRPHLIWHEFAKFYLEEGKIDLTREVYERGIRQSYSRVEDLAALWCLYIEMELSQRNFENALKLLARATAPPSKKSRVQCFDQDEQVQVKVHKSLRLWLLYTDVYEMCGNFEAAKSVYDQAIAMKIATPQSILNYADLLERNNYFEDSFKVYECGISIFHWPYVYEIWNTYLIKFVRRYGGRKLERIRDLFEQVLSNCPEKYCKIFYIAYGQLEERYGLTKQAISIYEKATKRVPVSEKYGMYIIYINRVTELLGLTSTRPIYEAAMEVLPKDESLKIGLKYCNLEKALGEIDRSRGIYSYLSQLANPKVDTSFWATWQDFEIQHGNSETFREMLRIKRSVLARFNTRVNVSILNKEPEVSVDPMEAVERLESEAIDAAMSRQETEGKIKFVKSEKYSSQGNLNKENEDEELNLEKKEIPREIFGGLTDQ